MRISRLGEGEGFVTGYYEPIIDGSRTQTDVYTVPVYRRPSNLFVRGNKQSDHGLPNKGEVFRKIGRRKLVPYYDRAQIEDGAIAGRGLEICWLKNQTDLLFAQIQGSARIRLEDGSTIRINYDAHNGYPYTAVGRILIDRGIIPREQMSMQRIREWMDQNPDGAKELRRQNRSYIFFREVPLSDKDEAVGAQGVPLTPGRSIAVDKALHVYGTPFFIEGELPIESEQSKTPFRRLMVAQDTGSAIVGPARADIYFGAGADAGRVSGRLRNNARFVILVPKSLDPVARGRKMPLPDPRPSEKIAKLFPQVDPQRAPRKLRKTPTPATVRPVDRRRAAFDDVIGLAVPSHCRQPARTSNPAEAGVAIIITIIIIIGTAAADETPAAPHASRIAGDIAPQTRAQRRRACPVGERGKTDQTAPQEASLREGVGSLNGYGIGCCEACCAAEPAFACPNGTRSEARDVVSAAAAGAARASRALAAFTGAEADRCPARPAWHDADARPPRAVRIFAARPWRGSDIRARHHRQGQSGSRIRTRGVAPSGAAVAGPAGIPLAGGWV